MPGRKPPPPERPPASLPGRWPQLRKVEPDVRKKKGIPCPRPERGKENSFLSDLQILTGITSQDSECFLSCYNPLNLPPSPHPHHPVQACHRVPFSRSPPPQLGTGREAGAFKFMAPSRWKREVLGTTVELISDLNTVDCRASVCGWLRVSPCLF